MIKKSKKTTFLGSKQIIPLQRKRSFIRHLENRLENNPSGICLPGRRRYHSVFCPVFSSHRTTDTKFDRLKLRFLNKKRRRAAVELVTDNLF